MRTLIILLVVATVMILVTGCPKGNIRISSPIQVNHGPSQVGLFVDEDWNNSLRAAKNVINDRWTGVKWDETWAQNLDSINKIGKTTFNVFIYPSITMFGDPGYEMFIVGGSSDIGTYIGEANFGSDRDPKPTAKVQVTAPIGSRVAIVKWGEPCGPPAVVYLLGI